MNWKKKGRHVLRKLGNKAFEGQLTNIVEDAEASKDTLHLALGLRRKDGDHLLSWTFEDLCLIERRYRDLAQNPSQNGVDLSTVERLMALFLGQTLIARYGGRWKTYSGKFHTLTPFVLEIGTVKKSIDPFAFCKDLKAKSGIPGSREAKALLNMAQNAEKNALL